MAEWRKSEVLRQLSEAIAPVVNTAGFRFKKSTQAFVRKIDAGRQELGLALVDYNPEFQFSFNLCVRLEAVQEIVNRFSGSPTKYHSTTLSSITQLEFLGLPTEAGSGVVYRVKTESELAAVLPGVLEMLRKRVLPFFEEHRDIVALNRGLNPPGAERQTTEIWPPDRRTFDATNQPYRAMAGVAAAYLAADSRLRELIEAYRSRIQAMQASDQQKFEEMVAYLLAQA